MNGAERLCTTLAALDCDVVFGLPGTQNIVLYDALRRAGLRTVAAADEGAAAFMASGYARATGRVGVLTTIPGPGFVYALAGVVEALHDSVPLLWITLRQPDEGQAFTLQRIDQAAMARPVVKALHHVARADALATTLSVAQAEAVSGEPGPVLVEIEPAVLREAAAPPRLAPPAAAAIDFGALETRLASARRPLIYAGQGAQGAAAAVRELAQRWRAPVLCTASGRGVMPDDHPLARVADFSSGVPDVVTDLIQQADCVLALGCKFTHNGSAGGRLALPRDKLVRVDAAATVLAANYPASLTVCAPVEAVVPRLARALSASAWTDDDLDHQRTQFAAQRSAALEHEPRVDCGRGIALTEVFGALRRAFGTDTIYTTDAGLHQSLTRRYATVTTVRGLLCPSDFQSMGFGLPAAIGAALGRPEAAVVACIGDGALLLSLGDLFTAVREGVNVVIVVFNDGAYGLIRRQQLLNFGVASGTNLQAPDYAALAQAAGCSYFPVSEDLDELMQAVAATSGVRLLELPLVEAGSLGAAAQRRALRERVIRALPESAIAALKRLRR